MKNDAGTSPAVRSAFQLCSLADRQFVRTAYLVMLGREADPVGERQFTDQLRLGMAKTHILHALHSSPEGQARPVTLPGLKRKLAMVRLFNARIFRRLGIPRSGQYSNSPAARASRRMENDVARLIEEHEATTGRLDDLEGRVRRLNERLSLVETSGGGRRQRSSHVSVEQLLDMMR